VNSEKLTELPIIDCHVHYFGGPEINEIDRHLAWHESCGVSRLNALMLSVRGVGNTNPDGFYAKARHPGRVWLFAALDYSAIVTGADHRWTLPLPEQIDRFIAAGCDGLKLLNGKPTERKSMGIALDSPVYEGCFARLEERGFPVLWHVNDPEQNWDSEKVPEDARKHGWYYDSSYPSKEAIYGECERVLERHPKLKVIFAHFYFLSADLPRAAALLERYPNVHLDVTPGTEMYINFTRQHEESREFFLRYQDRILFGTDSGFVKPEAPRPDRYGPTMPVRRFLETGDTYNVSELWLNPADRGEVRGLALPTEALRKIYAENFQRIVSTEPQPLNRQVVMRELNRQAGLCDELGASVNVARRVACHMAGEPEPEDWRQLLHGGECLA
jgi:predicted TIM-barrel fold metal-dependent hydrolase